MAEPTSLGARIRERRLALGFSLGQLATKVGRTAASVRAWERGDDVPDAQTLGDLGAALELDTAELERLARNRRTTRSAPADSGTGGATPPRRAAAAPATEPAAAAPETPPVQPERARAESKAAPTAEAPDAAPPRRAAKPAATDERATEIRNDDVYVAFEAPPVQAAASGAGTAAGSSPPAASGSAGPPATGRGPTQMQAPQDTAPQARAAAGPGEQQARRSRDLIDSPTEAIPVPVASQAATSTVAATRAAEPAPYQPLTNPLTALLDPDKRWLYWIRTALTAIVLLVFLFVLVWTARELFGALGDVLDSFGDATETTTTLP